MIEKIHCIILTKKKNSYVAIKYQKIVFKKKITECKKRNTSA